MNNEDKRKECAVRMYRGGKLHCDCGPAVQWLSGRKEYYINGKRHRIGGPAIELADGKVEWYKDGTKIRKTK